VVGGGDHLPLGVQRRCGRRGERQLFVHRDGHVVDPGSVRIWGTGGEKEREKDTKVGRKAGQAGQAGRLSPGEPLSPLVSVVFVAVPVSKRCSTDRTATFRRVTATIYLPFFSHLSKTYRASAQQQRGT